MKNTEKLVNNLLKEAKNDTKKLSKLLDEFLVPKEEEKKKNAEVSTPFSLRQEMTVKSFWAEPRKVFEPCSGKGGFLIDIVDKFMDGMKDLIPDEEERYRVIVEECLYWSEINPLNVFVCKMLLKGDKYKLNYHQGNTLELDITKKWGLEGFDLVIGNPPYNDKQNAIGKRGGGNSLWNKFVIKSLENWLIDGGCLIFVHPAGWRKPEGGKSKTSGLYNLMTNKNTMLYLEIHGTKDGMKMFKCGTRYDWYVIKKEPNKNYLTIIKDEDNIVSEINLKELPFLPNKNIGFIKKILNDVEDGLEVLFSCSKYETRKVYVSSKQNEEFKYPLIHSTPKTGTRYIYSSRKDLGFFGVSKVIFGETGINEVIIDLEGKYGMTQNSIGIKVETRQEAENIKKALESDKFKKEVLDSCKWSNYQIDWRLFCYFKKDFWKEFV